MIFHTIITAITTTIIIIIIIVFCNVITSSISWFAGISWLVCLLVCFCFVFAICFVLVFYFCFLHLSSHNNFFCFLKYWLFEKTESAVLKKTHSGSVVLGCL